MSKRYEELYVAINGNDQNVGTKESPLVTIKKAQQIARHLISQGKEVTIYIREGTHYLTETLRLEHEDTNLQIEAYPGEKVVISGGIPLKLQWQHHEGKIMKAKVRAGLNIDQLFVNGQAYHMARYPNVNPEERVFAGYAADCIDPERTRRWSNPEGGYIHVMHSHLWGGYHYRITGRDDDGNIQYEGGWQNNRQMGMHKKFRFVENIFEELDAPENGF